SRQESLNPDGDGAVLQLWIARGEQFGLWPQSAVMLDASLCEQMKSWRRLWKWNRRFEPSVLYVRREIRQLVDGDVFKSACVFSGTHHRRVIIRSDEGTSGLNLIPVIECREIPDKKHGRVTWNSFAAD